MNRILGMVLLGILAMSMISCRCRPDDVVQGEEFLTDQKLDQKCKDTGCGKDEIVKALFAQPIGKLPPDARLIRYIKDAGRIGDLSEFELKQLDRLFPWFPDFRLWADSAFRSGCIVTEKKGNELDRKFLNGLDEYAKGARKEVAEDYLNSVQPKCVTNAGSPPEAFKKACQLALADDGRISQQAQKWLTKINQAGACPNEGIQPITHPRAAPSLPTPPAPCHNAFDEGCTAINERANPILPKKKQ